MSKPAAKKSTAKKSTPSGANGEPSRSRRPAAEGEDLASPSAATTSPATVEEMRDRISSIERHRSSAGFGTTAKFSGAREDFETTENQK